MAEFAMTVNGRAVAAQAQPRTHLADFLREELLLTGTHLGCEHGVCGACTVMIDGAPARSCIAFAAACDGADVKTVEGFEDDSIMRALRAAFSRHHALQCGYCTPGMLITAYDIVRRVPDADRTRIREELAGNLCRCTGYVGIVDAVADVLAAPPAMPGPSTGAIVGVKSATPVDGVNLPRVADAAPGRRAPNLQSTAAGAGNHIERSVSVGAPSDAIWQTLRDPRTVVRCLPGAELSGELDDEQLAAGRLGLKFNVAIGPMRARFEGDAKVEYNDAERCGKLKGSGLDSASRTTGNGFVAFALEPESAQSTRLATEIDYRLSGPLAQFSRGAVVDAVVDRLLAQFADNLAAAASGKTVSDQQSVGGFGLVLGALWSRFRRLFGA